MKLSKTKGVLFSSILLLILYALIELFVGCYYAITSKKITSPSELLKKAFPQDWQSNTNIKCEYSKMLGPHPYMGFVMYGNLRKQCNDNWPTTVNNVLMSGLDYPDKKDPNAFVIMLTGGSVADQLGTASRFDGKNYLSDFLNEHYFSPNGKPFKIIVSALGDYRFPQNLIGPILHHQKLHGIIDLSGYNEIHQYNSNSRLETPSSNYWNQFDLENEFIEGEKTINNRKILKFARESWCSNSFSCFFIIEKYLQYQLSKIINKERRYDHQKSLFKYPNEWSEDEKWRDRINTHKGYYKINHQICKTFDLRCAYFIQPIPQILKDLTDVERTQVIHENPSLPENYARMSRELLEMSQSGIPIYSLLDVFKDQRQTIYSDHIHYFKKGDEQISVGNNLIIMRMAEILEKTWKLKKKK